jgi:coenzyme F420-reducing hydrogenase gamma subunit
MRAPRPKLAVWKFASCDGCQLMILNCEAELLALADAVEIAYFPEATRGVVEGPYDVSLVEGSVTTEHDARRIREVRDQSQVVVAIGACATAGGIQALRNLADADAMRSYVYPHPEYLATLPDSTPISAHVQVDFELRGCPIDKEQLLQVLGDLVVGRRPRVPRQSVCAECKQRGTVCLTVSRGVPCLGPVTQAGCGALCPAYDRGCYGCFGPQEQAQVAALVPRLRADGLSDGDVRRMFQTFNTAAPGFRVDPGRSEDPQ